MILNRHSFTLKSANLRFLILIFIGRGGMAGCSLHDAFPDTAKESGKVARREEKRRANQCKGPALAFLRASGEAAEHQQDPDRQHLRNLPPAEKLGGPRTVSEGFVAQDLGNREFMPVKASEVEECDRDLVKNLVGQRVDDVIGEKSRGTLPRAAENAAGTPNFRRTMLGDPVPSYFGRGQTDESFADYSSSLSDNPGYQLTKGTSDFLGSFGAIGLNKASGQPVLATPSVNDAWKPLTPSGSTTSFFEHLPAPGGLTREVGGSFSKDEKEALLKKLDSLFARLEELESKRNEYAHAEVTLFILSGLFLMFGLESVRKLSVSA
jgi:hypothetical protein